MYFKILVCLLCFFMCLSTSYAENAPISKDTSLNRVIVEKVILSEYQKGGFLMIKQAANFDLVDFLDKNKPYFPFVFQYLQSDFNLGTMSIKEIVNKHQYFLDDWISESFPKLSVVKPPAEGMTIELIEKLCNESGRASIITILTAFLDEEKGKCLVYYHFYQGGGMVAFLKKRNTMWQVVTHKAQSIE